MFLPHHSVRSLSEPLLCFRVGNPRLVQLHKEEERGQGLVGVLLLDGKRGGGV